MEEIERTEKDYVKGRLDVIFENITREDAEEYIRELGYETGKGVFGDSYGMMDVKVPKGKEEEAVEIIKESEYVFSAGRKLSERGFRKLLGPVVDEETRKLKGD